MQKPMNYMEVLVEQYMQEAFEFNTPAIQTVRRSPKLIAESMAAALNAIPPFYVTGKVGEVYGFSSGSGPQNKADIMKEIIKAIELTAQNSYTKK